MRPNIHVRSLARRPLYLLLLCLIIGAASFGFIAHAVEYVILRRETEQLGDYYRAVGTLSPNGEDFSCLPDGIALVESSNAVTLSDQRQYASALLDGIQNIDYASTLGDDITLTPRRSESFGLGFELSGNRTTDIVFDGVLTDVVVGKNVEPSCELTFSVDNIYATRPEYQVETGSVATIAYLFSTPDEAVAFSSSLATGERYLACGYYNFYNYINYYGFGPSAVTEIPRMLIARPLDGQEMWLLPLGDEGVDWNDSALAALKNDIDKQEIEKSAMMVIGTRDMSAMPCFLESSRSYHLQSGRYLDQTDEQNGLLHCVISNRFAQARGLSVGDQLALTFRQLEYPFWFGFALDIEKTPWNELPTSEVEFEIVGIISPANERTDFLGAATDNVVYVPTSSIPSGYGKTLPSAVRVEGVQAEEFGTIFQPYSFVVGDALMQDQFIAQNRAALEDLGLSLQFAPNGAQEFWRSAGSMLDSVLLNVIVFGALLVLLFGFSAFMYWRFCARSFAISRALGLPLRTAIRQVLAPYFAEGAVGVATGGLVAVYYAVRQSADKAAILGAEADSLVLSGSLCAWAVALCLVVFVLLMVIAVASARWTARRPVLSLLQGTPEKRRKK